MEGGNEPALPTFRAEAVAHRGRYDKARGEMIEFAPSWTRGAFYGVAAAFLIAVIALSLIQIDRRARGVVAVRRDGAPVVLLPAAQASELRRGSTVELGGRKATVASFEDEVLYPEQIRRRFRSAVSVPSVVVVLEPSNGARPGDAANVLIDRDPLLVALVPGLSALFGD